MRPQAQLQGLSGMAARPPAAAASPGMKTAAAVVMLALQVRHRKTFPDKPATCSVVRRISAGLPISCTYPEAAPCSCQQHCVACCGPICLLLACAADNVVLGCCRPHAYTAAGDAHGQHTTTNCGQQQQQQQQQPSPWQLPAGQQPSPWQLPAGQQPQSGVLATRPCCCTSSSCCRPPPQHHRHPWGSAAQLLHCCACAEACCCSQGPVSQGGPCC
jgi:hypothetical protein